MTRYARHIGAQGPSLSALFGLVSKAATQALSRTSSPKNSVGLGLTLRETVKLPSLALQVDFVRFCGGDPAQYRDQVPPHLFSQWSMPVALRLAQRLPYPPLSVINLGCCLRVIGPIRAAEGEAVVQCTVKQLDENEERVKITLGLLTLIRNEPALSADLRLLIRLPGKTRSRPKPNKPVPVVTSGARELSRMHLARNAGSEFARLTGDFNPIHWVPPYARALGFRGPILHGFASFALAFESIVSARLSGQVCDVRRFDANFDAPLVLPHDVGVFWLNNQVFVGDAASGPSYMTAAVRLN